MLAIPVPDLDATYEPWRPEGPPVTLKPEGAYWSRIFYDLDPDRYELMFEQYHAIDVPT